MDLCVFKAAIVWEVRSILSATTPAATEAKHTFLKYLATGSREEELSPEAPVCMYQSPIIGCLVSLSAGKKIDILKGGRRSDNHRLANDELYVASGVLLFIWFFPITIFSSLKLFRVFFFPKGVLATCSK